jgi:ParB-like chromosome segregation protein Spo0J
MPRAKAVTAPEQSWPADKVERRPLAELIPYARNPRAHGEESVAQIAASMVEWGWTMPVLVDEQGVLIAGHGRVLAAQRLGYDEAPVMVATGWSKAQIAAYRLADNRIAMSSTWDPDLLRIEIGDLKDLGFDLDLTGFGAAEIEELFHDWGDGSIDVERHGENLDGIEVKVIVRCDQEQRERVLEAVQEALKGWTGVTVE